MSLNWFLLATLCWLPMPAAAQQSTAPAATAPAATAPAANSPAQIQPQVWPPPATPAQAQPQQAAPVAAAPAAAQSPAAAPRQPYGQIQLDVMVTDKAGMPINGLNRSDFTLLDNNHPAEIQSFQAYGGSAGAPPQPTQILLVVDMVNLGFEEVSYSRTGIDQFLRSDGGHLGAPVSIYWYTDRGMKGLAGATAPSTDGNTLAAQLDATSGELRTMNSTAGAWGAIERYEMSVRMLGNVAHVSAGQPGRKLLIWIGPGWPILDSPNMEMTWKDQQKFFANIVDLSTAVREAQMQIYSVAPGLPDSSTYLYQAYTKGVKKASQVALPDLDLKVLAVHSGGLALPPSNDLTAEIEKCAREAAGYYVISFTPPPADRPDEYHDLKIRLDKPDLTARTDTGYYSQPPGKRVPQ